MLIGSGRKKNAATTARKTAVVTYTRFAFMSGSRPRCRMFFAIRYTGQMNMLASDRMAIMWLITFSFGPRKSDSIQMMLNVIVHR